VHESGTGAMWIAPELVARPLSVDTCAHSGSAYRRELVFETLDANEIDPDLPRMIASAKREAVDFEWNAATGELSFSATDNSAVFGALATLSRASAAQACEAINLPSGASSGTGR